MGWSLSGVCYQDTASALVAFSNAFPEVSSLAITALSVAPTITASGVITYSTATKDLLTNNSRNVNSQTLQLGSCSIPTVNQWPIQDYALLLGLFFACFLGFRTGYKS